jgi:DNA-binding NtrC family response regulator
VKAPEDDNDLPEDESDHPGPMPAPLVTEGFAEPSSHVLVRRFALRVIGGPDADRRFVSQKGSAVIGTHESADLVLTDRTVSRFHCEIRIEEGRAIVRDLGSRNGTLVDGVTLLQGILRDGQTLAVGRSEIRFELGTDHVEVPLSSNQRFGRMVGRSAVMRATFALLERAAGTDATVLLEGETGTGKEAAAESIHAASTRGSGPFIVVDCGAIPPDLLESELFGHEKGAFTGAIGTRTGAFEAASGGTIFLDEIGELTTDLQPKLLRALERREVKRVGTNKYVPVDVRVVAATNRNLMTEVNSHRFRSDLYYRLAVVEIRLPSLRERREDLPLLVEYILESLDASDRPEAAPLRTPAALASLGRHAWPGNVRELRNYVERCLTLREAIPPAAPRGEGQQPTELLDDTRPFKEAREVWTRAFERQYLERILARHQDNVTAAARAAGLDRMYFYRLLWRHRLR